MSERRFRFGVTVTPQPPERWLDVALRVRDLGYSVLLMPDGTQLLATLPSLAAAATAVPELRVSSYVMASPLHQPGTLAWEAHTLSALTSGRFELGIGTGRPEAVRDQAPQLTGEAPLSATERLQRVRDTLDRLRELDGDQHTPVLIAAAGPRAQALAVEKADILALPFGPTMPREQSAAIVSGLRETYGTALDRLELMINLFQVGDEVSAWAVRMAGVDEATLRSIDSLSTVRGTTDEMVEELERRREQLGISYFGVNGQHLEAFAPVVERLQGR